MRRCVARRGGVGGMRSAMVRRCGAAATWLGTRRLWHLQQWQQRAPCALCGGVALAQSSALRTLFVLTRLADSQRSGATTTTAVVRDVCNCARCCRTSARHQALWPFLLLTRARDRAWTRALAATRLGCCTQVSHLGRTRTQAPTREPFGRMGRPRIAHQPWTRDGCRRGPHGAHDAAQSRRAAGPTRPQRRT